MKIKNRFKKPIALLLSICMVLPLLGYASYVALAQDKADPAEALLDEGAMWLDDFMKGHPGAQIHGFDGVSAYALGDGDGEVGVDPGWFKVYVLKMGDESETGPFSLAGGKNTNGSLLNAFTSGGDLDDMTLDYPTSAYTPNNWPKSGAMTWTKQGFVEDSAGFPQMTGRYNGYDFQYAIKSAYLGDSRIFNMGMVTVDGEERLWISLDRAGATAVILPDTQVSERISLHYAPEEFSVTYSVTVDGKDLNGMTEAEISAVWGDGITTPEQAMTAILGKNPTTSTKSQTAEVQITVPAGTYGSVFFDDDTTQTYPAGDYGNRRLGEEVGYTYQSTGTGDAKQEWTDPTARFSYSEPYSYGAPGKADGEVKVRVVIETRVKTGYQYNLDYFYSFDGRSNVYNSSPAFNTAARRIGDLDYNASDDTYSWTWTFQVGNNNRYNGILRLGINGQLVSIPHAVGQYEETVMSDGSIVKVELTNRTFRNNNNGAGEGYYTVTVSNARRDVIITEFITDELYIYGRLIVESVDGIHMEIKNRATTSSSGSSSIHDYRNWDTYAAGGIIRYQNDNSYEFNFVGNQIRVSLNQGYVWPGTTQDGIIPDTVNDVGDTVYYDTAGWETDVLIYPSVKKSLTLVKDDPDNPQVSYSGARNQYGGPYDTNNNNAIWYYVTSLTADQLPAINNVSGRQSFIHINAIQQTYEIKYLPGITVNNGNVTVTGGNKKYDVPNANGTGTRADGFKWFVLDKDSMPFAGSNDTDETLYTMQSGSNRALVSLTEPLDNSSVSSAQFQYWVLTDTKGNPVKADGTPADVNDESTWVKYYPGEYIDLPDIEGYTKTKGAAGFQGDAIQRFTVYLTAYWGEPETPYTNFVTVNSDAYVENGKALPKTQFAGKWYNKTDGNEIADDDTTTPDTDKIKVAIPVISFLDMDEVHQGDGNTEDKGVTVSVTKNSLLNFMRSQGGDNLWYKLDDTKNHDYIWEDVDDLGELDVWFLYTLGSLKITNTVDGSPNGIEFKVTFKLPNDNTLTAGNESQFFGTSSYKVATDKGDVTLSKDENDAYVGYFTLNDAESIEFTKLPNGTWYLIELAEDGHNGNNNRGYVMKDGDEGDVYDFTASTVWEEHNGTKDTDMTIEKVVSNGVVRYGNKEKGIIAYDTHEIKLTVLGTYTIDLTQTSVHPDKDPTTDDEAVNTDDNQPNVQNFSYLTYTVTAKNLTSYPQDLKVVLGIKSEDISERVDQNGDLDGVRILNIEEIDGDNKFTIESLSSSDDEELYKITLTDGTEIIYDCTGETHTMTWVDEQVASGDATVHTVKTSVPAVRGLTNYTGSASVDDSESSNSVVGKPIASNDVTARVYSYWLRILAYVVDETYQFPDGGEGPTFKFRVTLTDSNTSNALNETVHYMLFNSSEDFGTGNAAEGSPFEVELKSTGTDGEYYFDFELKHGQRIVIYDLDEDFTYKVEATNFKDFDYMQSKLTTNTSGKINNKDAVGDGIDMVAFHFYPTQSLTVNSTINDGIENTTKTFSYDVTLTLPEGLDWDSDVPTFDIGSTHYTLTKQADFTDENGGVHAVYKVTVSLGDAQSFVIPDIPEATEYKIAANIDNGYSFSAKKGTEGVGKSDNPISGTLGSEGDVYNVTVTKNGQLTIKANVNSSLSSDLTGTYKFSVTLKGADGKPLSGTFQMGSTTVTFNSQGKATVSVPVNKTGDRTASGSVTVTDIPANTSYTVTPISVSKYMTLDIEDDATGTIGAGGEVTVERTFTRMSGSLTIEKEVADYNKADDGNSFQFTVTLTDDNNNFVNGTFYIGETAVTFNNGEAVVTVPVNDAGKGSVTITGIPAGVSYEIVENLDDADEYYPDWNDTDEGVVDAADEGGTTAKCFNEKTVTVEWSLPDNFWFQLSDVKYNASTHRYIGNAISRLEDKTDEDYCITVTNKTNSNLPISFKYIPDAAYTQLTGSFKIGTGDQGNNKAIVPGQGTTQTEFDLSLVGGAGVEVTEEVVNSEKFMSGIVILVIGEEGVVEEP